MKGLLTDIPNVEETNAMTSEMEDWGAETWKYTIDNLTLDGYRAYIDKFRNFGYIISAENAAGLRNYFYNVVMKKDNRTLRMSYYTKLSRLTASVSYIAYQVRYDAEKVYEGVPMTGLDSDVDASDYGADNYVKHFENKSQMDYNAYLSVLKDNGYSRFSESSVGTENKVYNAVYTKGEQVLTVTYIQKQETLYLSATYNLPLSEHLNYNASYIAENTPGAVTKLHMLKLKNFGNSFIIELKNGHFIVSDGGMNGEMESFIQYIKSLVPAGEKPVIEAWFISHAHVDHAGLLRVMAQSEKWRDEVYVEGIYYNEPNELVQALDPGTVADVALIRRAAECLKTESGTHPQLYRTQTGQVYYFNDISVGVVAAQEQIPFENYSGDFNDSSTWLMLNVGNQKCLLGGDGDLGGMKFIMNSYDADYLDLDVFTLLHHGYNTWDNFTNFIKRIDTVLVTDAVGKDSIYSTNGNANLRNKSKEWIAWGDGTKILSFPYTVGSYRSLPSEAERIV